MTLLSQLSQLPLLLGSPSNASAIVIRRLGVGSAVLDLISMAPGTAPSPPIPRRKDSSAELLKERLVSTMFVRLTGTVEHARHQEMAASEEHVLPGNAQWCMACA